MQNNMNYSVFTNNIADNIDKIDKIKSFLQNANPTIDFVIFTDEITYRIPSYSMLTTFYMIASKGQIIFLNLEDFLEYKDAVGGEPVLFLSTDSLPNIDRNTIKNYAILIEEDNQLKWIRNYEL